MSNPNHTSEMFSPSEISRWFRIPKTTLYRWEALGEIPATKRRGPKAERIYDQTHLEAIAKAVRNQLQEEMRVNALHNVDLPVPGYDLQERLYLTEFISQTDKISGLQPLEALARTSHGLSDDTVRLLIEYALSRPRKDSVRAGIWKLLWSAEEIETQDGT